MKKTTDKQPDRMSLSDFKNLGLKPNTGKNNKIQIIDSKKPLAAQEKCSTRRSKFNAKKTTIDGIVFDSKFEAERYCILSVREKAKEISNLELQVPFDILVNEQKICTYVADFVYIEDDKRVVEDAKGVKTPEYRLKKKLMKAALDIDILETYKSKR